MNKISVVGLGPGHPDYILPVATKIISESDIIIGGSRNLRSIDTNGKKVFPITSELSKVIDIIKENYLSYKIAVVVSGDTGFYSLLRYLKRHLDNDILQVIPGISSLQYMFAKIGYSWEDAYIGSLHGRENDFVDMVKKYKKVGLLTDKKWTPSNIAKELLSNGISDRTIYVGENLSYENEKITEKCVVQFCDSNTYDMCVVVIVDEK